MLDDYQDDFSGVSRQDGFVYRGHDNRIGDDELTTWTYDEATGLLLSKTYDDSNAVTYSYTPDGKLATRTWARMIGNDHPNTTYVYDEDTGDLIGVEYRIGENDDPNTPNVTNTRDRLGRIATVKDGASPQNARMLMYNPALQLGYEDIDERVRFLIPLSIGTALISALLVRFLTLDVVARRKGQAGAVRIKWRISRAFISSRWSCGGSSRR